MARIEAKEDVLRQLRGKTVLITGGANGIGKAAVKMFHAYGANIAIGDMDEGNGQLLANSIGESCLFQKTDVTNWASLMALFRTTFDRFLAIDFVCANAGMPEKDIQILSDDLDEAMPGEPDFRLIDVNLNGALRTAKLALHFFAKNRTPGGALVFTGSAASYFGSAPICGYGAAKHAILGLMRSLSTFSSMRQVRVNLVAPWMTETDFSSEVSSIWSELPKNTADEVAKALLIACADKKLHGRGLYVAKDIIDLELPLYQNMPEWMTKEHAELFEQGRERLAVGMGFPREHHLESQAN